MRYFWQWNQYERDRWIERVVAARVAPGSRVIDVGAGSCPYAHLFGACEYRTHDFKQLGSAQLAGRGGYGAIDYVSDVTAIPAPTGGFDVVLCSEVIEHVPEPALAVKEMARLLAPGGLLILTAPLGSGLHQMPFHFYGGYTPSWYERELGAAGFVDIEVTPNRLFFSLFSQEGLRFLQKSAPWKSVGAVLALPLWLIALPLLGVVLPVLAPLLDRLDRERDFTAGYFVLAQRTASLVAIAPRAPKR